MPTAPTPTTTTATKGSQALFRTVHPMERSRVTERIYILDRMNISIAEAGLTVDVQEAVRLYFIWVI
jgi:hypothetical protein